MMQSPSNRRVVLLAVVLAAFTLCAFQVAMAADVEHAIEGSVSKVDKTAKTVTIQTADGADHVFHYTARTTVHGAKDTGMGAKKVAVDSYFAGKEGTHAVVHYTGEGADKTAIGMKDLGKDTVKLSEGTIDSVDHAGRTVTVKAADGSKTTYHFAKDGVVEGSHGVESASKWTYKSGDKVTVHYTEDAGKKIAHLVEHV